MARAPRALCLRMGVFDTLVLMLSKCVILPPLLLKRWGGRAGEGKYDRVYDINQIIHKLHPPFPATSHLSLIWQRRVTSLGLFWLFWLFWVEFQFKFSFEFWKAINNIKFHHNSLIIECKFYPKAPPTCQALFWTMKAPSKASFHLWSALADSMI